MSEQEQHRLDAIAAQSLYSAGVNTDTILYSFGVFRRYLTGASLLEMGPAEGVMTAHLVTTGLKVSVVEGSRKFCDELARRHPEVEVHCSLFEGFRPGKTFDNIVLGHVLEHVEDPVGILQAAARWLSPQGRIMAAVPNSRSLHRQAAVLMGLLPFEEAQSDLDRHHGHRRVYNPETLRRDFLAAGLKVEVFGGYWLKPLSNRQLEQTWTPEMLAAFMALGERYPDIAGEIYVVARR